MDLSNLLPIGVTLIVVGLVLAFGLQILGETRPEMCDSDYTYNTSSGYCTSADNTTASTHLTAQMNGTIDAITGVAKFPTKLPLIATVVVAVVIIGILIKYFTTR